MTDRAAPLVTTLSVLAFMGWLALASDGSRGPDGPRRGTLEGGSGALLRNPVLQCELPVRLHVAYVDPRFGVSVDSVVTAIRRATEMWEQALDRDLFVQPGKGGIPVRLIYDHRQARTDERARAEDLVRREDETLASETADLARAWENQHDLWAFHRAERAALITAVSEHNVAVRLWNERGGAPESIAAELTRDETRLEQLERHLDDDALRLRRDEDSLRQAELGLTDRVAARNAEAGRLARIYGPVAVESGAYLGSEGAARSRSEGVHREIRVFRFRNGDELVRVLAHELGHALGLGHVDEERALMHGLHGRSRGEEGPPRVHPIDQAALETYCGWGASR